MELTHNTHELEVAIGIASVIIMGIALTYKAIQSGRRMAKKEPVLRQFKKGEKVTYNPELIEMDDCIILSRLGDYYDIRIIKTHQLIRGVHKNKLHKKH